MSNLKDVSNLYVQYGCGWSAPEGWVNFDSSPTLLIERLPLVGKLLSINKARFPENVIYGDIVSGLPVLDGSCSGIYCSHVIEHLAREDAAVALENTFRYLKRGGIFRIVVPDLHYEVTRYMEDSSETAADDFIARTYLGKAHRPKGLIGRIRSHFSNSSHLWMWDERSLRKQLSAVGFKSISKALYGKSIDPRFLQVESEERFCGAVAFECVK